MITLPRVHEVSALYHSFLKDVWRWAPDLVPCFDTACLRVVKLVKTRGPRVVLVELPKLGKLFDKSLSTGYLDISSIPSDLGSWRKGTVLLQSLLSSWVYEHDDRSVKTDLDPSILFLIRTFLYMYKKSIKECSDEFTEKAVREFYRIDRSLQGPTLPWNCDWVEPVCHAPPRFASTSLQRCGRQTDLRFGDSGNASVAYTSKLLQVLGQVAGRVIGDFPELLPHTIIGRHGPGAVADVKTGDDKYSFPFWPDKLGHIFPYELHACTRDDYVLECDKPLSRDEPPARLLAVPKTFTKPRLITSEPTAHQFLQQGLLKWIRKNLPHSLRIAISFDSQEPSRAAALEASKHGDMCTLDLSSASDHLSLWTVERIFSSNISLLRALHATRTRRVKNMTHTWFQGEQILLKKYAGQGNATTFPVQSIVYALCCITAVLCADHGLNLKLTRSRINQAAGKVRVFGDDIIIPSSSGLYLTVILELLQLKVNWGKTHTRGKFRESCGTDAFNGVEVTPFYLGSPRLSERPKPEELISWIDISNNAFQQGLWSIAEWMDSQIPDKVRKLLVTSRHDQAGLRLHTFVNGAAAERQRICKDLQRPVARLLTVDASTEWRRRDTHDSLLQFFTEDPPYLSKYKSGWAVRKRSRFVKRWVTLISR